MTRFLTAFLLVTALAVAAPASAQHQGGTAAVRTAPRAVAAPRVVSPGVVHTVPFRPYYYPYRAGFYPYHPGFSFGFYFGYPGFYGYPYAYPYGYYGYPYGLYRGTTAHTVIQAIRAARTAASKSRARRVMRRCSWTGITRASWTTSTGRSST